MRRHWIASLLIFLVSAVGCGNGDSNPSDPQKSTCPNDEEHCIVDE